MRLTACHQPASGYMGRGKRSHPATGRRCSHPYHVVSLSEYTWLTSNAMADLVVVPRLRRLLRERRLALDELHRRLVAKGDAPSRAALARLAQERPIRVIRMETVLPILEELEVPFATLFESLPRAEWKRRESANGQARAVATTLVDRNGRGSPLTADEETDAAIARLQDDLRASSPELFDHRGRLRKRALVARLTERFGSRTVEGEEVVRRINAARHHGRAP